jgi:hypothetical protein
MAPRTHGRRMLARVGMVAMVLLALAVVGSTQDPHVGVSRDLGTAGDPSCSGTSLGVSPSGMGVDGIAATPTLARAIGLIGSWSASSSPTSVAVTLSDVEWRTNYPHRAGELFPVEVGVRYDLTADPELLESARAALDAGDHVFVGLLGETDDGQVLLRFALDLDVDPPRLLGGDADAARDTAILAAFSRYSKNPDAGASLENLLIDWSREADTPKGGLSGTGPIGSAWVTFVQEQVVPGNVAGVC